MHIYSSLAGRARLLAHCAVSAGLGLAAALLLLAVAGRPAHAGATVIIVNPGDSIQAAINSANDFDVIQINPGTYTESLTLNKPVGLQGTNSATTIIQAAAGQRVITVTGVSMSDLVVISGLTFQGGDVDGGTVCPENCGGGMLILTGTIAPQLQNLVFRNNAAYAGGGVFAATSLTVTGTLFTNNTAVGDGGGLHVPNSAPEPDYQVNLGNTQFISNVSVGYGGGAYLFGRVVISNGTFERNRCTGSCSGGGLVSQYLTMTNTSFYTNSALFVGGGAYNTVYGVISGGLFQGNTTSSAGGGLAVRTEVHLTGTHFISNSTELSGGALHLSFGDPGLVATVSDAYFERNTCTLNGCNGGALGSSSYFNLVVAATDFLSNTAKGNGGAIQTGASLTLTNSLLRGNSCSGAGCQGGALAGGGNTTYLSGVTVLNNSAQGGGGGAYLVGSATILASVFQGNACLGASCNGGGVRAENGLIITSTQFLSNTSQGKGGGVGLLGAGDLRVVNSLFADNVAVGVPGQALWYNVAGGQGVVLHSTFAAAAQITGAAVILEQGTLGVTNTIVTSYTSGLLESSGTLYEDYNLFFNVSSAAPGATSGGHHPTGDPLFVNPAAYDYHLRDGSPAIDAGANAGVMDDYDGDARPLELGFDLGYDEYAVRRVYLPLAVK